MTAHLYNSTGIYYLLNFTKFYHPAIGLFITNTLAVIIRYLFILIFIYTSSSL